VALFFIHYTTETKMTTIQGNTVPIELSFDSGTSWQILVCLEQYNVPTELPVTSTDTFCGPVLGTGTQTFNPTGTAICTTDPSAGSQVTYNRLLVAQTNAESFLFRVRHAASGSIGNNFFLKGSCKATSLDLQFTSTDVVKFSWTLTGEGTLDIANP
jgi:hypothetical protein